MKTAKALIVILTVTTSLLASAKVQAQSLPTNVLVGEWLDGSTNFADVSGYSPAGTHDGYLVGAGNYAWTNDVPPGKTGFSLFFTNSDTGIAISNSSTLDANYTNTFDNLINNAFSVTFWARGFPGAWSPWVSKYGEPEAGWQLRNYPGNGSLPFPSYACFTVRDGGVGLVPLGEDPLGNPDDMVSSIPSKDGNWHFYAGVYSAVTSVRSLYIDGTLAAQETNNVAYSLAPGEHLCIGAKDSPPGNSFGNFSTFEIYDVRIHNYALPPPPPIGGPLPEPTAPSFITQPGSQVVNSGQPITFTAAATGYPPPTYQWQFNSTNIPGATNATYTLSPSSITNIGWYDVVISNAVGTNISGMVTAGFMDLNMLAAVNVTAPIGAQYQIEATPVPTASNWTTLTNVSIPSQPFIYVDYSTPTNSQQFYRTDAETPPPGLVTGLVGEWLAEATNFADISGYSPAGTHDGYLVGADNYTWTNDVPPGKTGFSLFFTNSDTGIAISNSSTLDANYTNTFDNLISNAFSVTFWARDFLGIWKPWVSKYGEPEAGWQMRTGVFPATIGAACFTVRDNNVGTGLIGLPPVYSGDQDDMGSDVPTNDGNWHFYTGVYSAVTTLRSLYIDGVLAAQETNNAAYILAPAEHLCIGAKDIPPGNSFGNFSTFEIYDVRIYDYDLSFGAVPQILQEPLPVGDSLPSFIAPPVSQVGSSGQSITFAAVASGNPPPTYQWRYYGSSNSEATIIPGATNAAYTVSSTGITNIGWYDVLIDNSYGNATSSKVMPGFLDLNMLAAVYLTGPIGAQYLIEATPVSAPTNWTTLTNVTVATQPYIFVDYSTPTNSKQLYRAVPQ